MSENIYINKVNKKEGNKQKQEMRMFSEILFHFRMERCRELFSYKT